MGAGALAELGGAVIQGGATLLAGYYQNKANKEMNADNLKLAYIQRGDTLQQNAFANEMAKNDRRYRDAEAAYQKRVARRDAITQRLQNDMAFRNNFLTMFNSRQPRRVL